ncbi:sigma-70 family RNA polymerase sigma factor [Paenibacillus harenae]|uniref:sigma-70 family RNA polymerase sigma factor n=1 Tax=Paenibacillus harenae TaxID=306543 RepID=UPI00278F3D6E|nr:sigma-70 family RNA polymerase sigma factor [Paenibacillus harenae]MDQ0059447.1 DNA-directed RNA polymerase specialized sigma24 family protein [Paenibacillus harenae]
MEKDVWKLEFAQVWGRAERSDDFDDHGRDNRYPQIKYQMLGTTDWREKCFTNPEELYEEGLERLHTVFSEIGPINETRLNAIYTNPLVQVIVSRAVEKLVALCWHKRPCRDDLYQETYEIARKITESYYRKHEQSEDIVNNYLGYLRKYLYYKLQRRYLTGYQGYMRRGKEYILPSPVVDPSEIIGYAGLVDSFIDKEDKLDLLEYVGRKKQQYIDIINYSVFYDLTQQQIADMMQMPLSTVKSHFSRSKPVVKQWMNNRKVV